MQQTHLQETMSAYAFKNSNSNSKPPPPPPPFPLRSILVFCIALFGFYVCYFSFSQIALENEESVNATEEEQTEIPFCRTPATIAHDQLPYLHFPKPATYDRGECACTPVRFFVIVSMQRSGSGWFETLLNSHPNVSSNGEIFSVKDRRENISSVLRTLDKLYNMDWLTSAAKNECTAAFGLKWMLNQGLMEHHHEVANYLNKKGATVIFLFRRNTLRRLISVEANNYDKRTKQLNGIHKAHVHSKDEVSLALMRMQSQITIIYFSKHDLHSYVLLCSLNLNHSDLTDEKEIICQHLLFGQADILARFKPNMDVSTLVTSIRSAEQSMRTCLGRFSSTRHMILYYEDVLRDKNVLSRVQEFLGVPVKKLFSKHVKIHTRPLPDLVHNWEDVSEILDGTEYARFLDDADYVN